VGLARAAGHPAPDSGNRTYYDFPDIDIDRYTIDGTVGQMMLAVRELKWTSCRRAAALDQREAGLHARLRCDDEPGQRFTSEGLPTLVLSNMPVQSTIPSMKLTRPEIYFGELTNTDVYVNTRQKEFNYPQGETNSTTSYEARAASCSAVICGVDDRARPRRSHEAAVQRRHPPRRGRLLMRRSIHERLDTLAGPF